MIYIRLKNTKRRFKKKKSDKGIDKFVEKLQKKIVKEEISECNKYMIDFLQNPKNFDNPEKDDISVSQSYTGPYGDTM